MDLEARSVTITRNLTSRRQALLDEVWVQILCVSQTTPPSWERLEIALVVGSDGVGPIPEPLIRWSLPDEQTGSFVNARIRVVDQAVIDKGRLRMSRDWLELTLPGEPGRETTRIAFTLDDDQFLLLLDAMKSISKQVPLPVEFL